MLHAQGNRSVQVQEIKTLSFTVCSKRRVCATEILKEGAGPKPLALPHWLLS